MPPPVEASSKKDGRFPQPNARNHESERDDSSRPENTAPAFGWAALRSSPESLPYGGLLSQLKHTRVRRLRTASMHGHARQRLKHPPPPHKQISVL